MSDRLLFLGEPPRGAAPNRTLATALVRYGMEAEFFDHSRYPSTRDWLHEVRQYRALVLTRCYHAEAFYLRQLALAQVAGRPVVRWWVGTDVLHCLNDEKIQNEALQIDRLVTLNIAVAPHLVDELETIGIHACCIPSIMDRDLSDFIPNEGPLPKALLVYLPSNNRETYCDDLIGNLVACNPDVQFVISADREHRWAEYPNVQCRGWIDDEDMEAVWQSVGGVLRLTVHDGLPRMMLEALLRGKHAIYSWPLDGCVLARTQEEAQSAIESFQAQTEINHQGIQAAKEMLTPDPAEVFATRIRSTSRQWRLSQRIRAIHDAATLTLRLRKSTSVQEGAS